MPKRPQTSRNSPPAGQRGKVKSDFPKDSLERVLRIPDVIEQSNGGRPLPPTDLAIALRLSPLNSEFQIQLASSAKYGLTSGNFRAERITLEPLGSRIVAPTSSEDRARALVAAALVPQTFGAMYAHLRGKKVPDPTFFENTVVREFAVPREHAKRCVAIFLANLRFVGLLRSATTGEWVSSEIQPAPLPAPKAVPKGDVEPQNEGREQESVRPDEAINGGPEAQSDFGARPLRSRRVFVTHGKNKTLVPQLKELLTFGQFEPVVSVERESVSKPVPDKVMDEMRGCGAAIIHVDAERELMTPEGDKEVVLNHNVLIEIGAALALYGRRFILLVQSGVRLPSNLHGLYEVRYKGESLDGEATLKLLKAFNDFKNYPPISTSSG